MQGGQNFTTALATTAATAADYCTATSEADNDYLASSSTSPAEDALVPCSGNMSSMALHIALLPPHTLLQDIAFFMLFSSLSLIYGFLFFLRKRREHGGRASSLRSSSGQSQTSPRAGRKVSGSRCFLLVCWFFV